MEIIKELEQTFKKGAVVDVRSGDTVKVHQKIKEGNKERVQIFQGLVIRTDRKGSHTSRITVRRIASGVGVEKSFLLHSPLVLKIEVTKRSKVRRNYLSYMRKLTGKSARLTSVDFDRHAVNNVRDLEAEKAEAEAKAAAAAEADAKAADKAAEEAKLTAKQQAVEEAHKAAA
ncbi:50S ribosomal protein L19 [Candidatus Saccharibacteria bacterium]|jgi:large subunit ribosomal protein L19|nr:50S ribosomal protein L19 [Candidatus Saccharibacteria bacterium]